MARFRQPGVEYTRHTLEDRPETEDTLKLVDSEGNVVDAGAENPVTTTMSSSDLDRDAMVLCLLENILKELKKSNEYFKEAMDGEVL